MNASEWNDLISASRQINLIQSWEYGEAKALTSPWQVERGVISDNNQVIGAAQTMIRRAPVGNGGMAWKADAVVGFKADRLLNPILSVETYLAPNSDLYWSVIPGVLIRGKERGRTWQVGLEQKNGPSQSVTGIRIGYWIDF